MTPKKFFEIQKTIYEKINEVPTVIFDVGANVGDVTKEYSAMFPNSKIYCFEPVPNTFKELKNRVHKTLETIKKVRS